MKPLPIVFLVASGLCVAIPQVFGPNGPKDESAWRRYVIADDPTDGPSSMYSPAIEGGPTGTRDDLTIGNYVTGEPGGPVPSGGPPSPLFGAGKFEFALIRTEELALDPYEVGSRANAKFPMPSSPSENLGGYVEATGTNAVLDDFIQQPLWPEPTFEANDVDQNPWKPLVEQYLGRTLSAAPAEGRPPGQGWAHQRWDEFFPEEMITTVTTGVRENTGLRDGAQRHGYSHGTGGFSEFGPGGLYHEIGKNDLGLPSLQGTTQGLQPRIHPRMPVQGPDAVWTFDGTFPLKMVQARVGKPILLRHYNGLPVDVTANRGFGMHCISTHEHNGHNAAESDGYAGAFYFPGQFYDYHWSMVVPGHDTINTDASDPRAGYPTDDGGIMNVRGDWREVASSHWFHDHMLDFTAHNVFKGMAAVMNYYSSIDRGNEAIDDGVNLRLPSGSALAWGNRDYDVNLIVSDKCWDDEGQLWYNPFQKDGMLGDRVLVNFGYSPFLDVRARKYRFRVLCASLARYWKFALVVERAEGAGQYAGPPGSGVSYDTVPFHMIANDGNLMEHAIPFDGRFGTTPGILPAQCPGERYDIVVDFAQFDPGDRLLMVNLVEHTSGRKPKGWIPLEEVLDGSYSAEEVDDDGDGLADEYDGGDPAVGSFLQFRVHELGDAETDQSTDLSAFEPGMSKLVEHNRPTPEELKGARTRWLKFGRSGGTDQAPWTVKTKDGSFTADTRRQTTAIGAGDLEVWTVVGKNGWSHPIHVHFEEGFILSKDEEPPPSWEQWARKDLLRLGPLDESANEIIVAIRFREFCGTYVEHCHVTTHEDNAMLSRWDIEQPGQIKLMPAPLPSWEGVTYVSSVALESARRGDGLDVAIDLGGGNGGGGNGGGGGGNDDDDDDDDDDDGD